VEMVKHLQRQYSSDKVCLVEDRSDKHVSHPTLRMHLSVIKEFFLQPAFHVGPGVVKALRY